MEVKIESGWKEKLKDEFVKDYFLKLAEFVKKEYHVTTVFPPGGLIFNAFNLCPFEKVKAVIIGQDPYHGPGQAHADDPENIELIKPTDRKHCGLCHSRHPAKNQNIIVQVDVNDHYIGKECIECHNPHKPWDLRNQDNPGENF